MSTRPGDGRPFRSAEQAWYWTMAALLRRRDGGGVGGDGRWVCTPDDVVNALDKLFREKRVSPSQVELMRHYGEKMGPPQQHTEHHRLWRDAMIKLQRELQQLGIVQQGRVPA